MLPLQSIEVNTKELDSRPVCVQEQQPTTHAELLQVKTAPVEHRQGKVVWKSSWSKPQSHSRPPVEAFCQLGVSSAARARKRRRATRVGHVPHVPAKEAKPAPGALSLSDIFTQLSSFTAALVPWKSSASCTSSANGCKICTSTACLSCCALIRFAHYFAEKQK